MKLICLDSDGKKYEVKMSIGNAMCGHRVLYAQFDKSDALDIARMLTLEVGKERLNGFLERLVMRFQHGRVDPDEISSR